ncbi:hypothetical protein L3X38_000394 [Prunus dulcis]|uniref:Micro-fibrillar-associated protein 1 C-terminal domain-containing protein n=1 Tax=Prunus dulcis TaxID=3755 RepID=A0AAD4UP40_PRUDU|nr:hypothetical protein L3X38_000394 [Prunus dulcis]
MARYTSRSSASIAAQNDGVVVDGVSDTVIAVRDKLRGKIWKQKLEAASLEKAFPTQEYDVVRKDYPRLRCVAESRIDNRDDVRADHRRIGQAEIVSTIEEESKRQEGLSLFPNSERYPIAELLQLEAEERALEESRKKNLEEKKRETKQIVVEEIRKGLEQEANIADIDTDDEVNEAEDYEAWKAREIARIKSDRDDWEAMLKEKEEIEKVTNMTEEERRERERKHPKAAPRRKQKWRFMQKYYHKGALFQSEADDYAATVGTDGIYTRDFSAPTGEDKMNKTILLKVMQVKHFGHSGRTKWTHLANEDTTNWKNPLSSI